MAPTSPSRSQHSLNTMPEERQTSPVAFPRYHDDENASSEEDTVAADEGAAFLRPTDDELSSDDASDIPPDRLKHHWARFIHPRIRKAAIWVARWTKGPNPPRIYKITPVFPVIQEAPIKLLDRYLPKRKHKIILLLAFYFVWFLTFALVLKQSAFSADVPGWGSPVRLGCGSTYW
jgi:hypothetical protein